MGGFGVGLGLGMLTFLNFSHGGCYAMGAFGVGCMGLGMLTFLQLYTLRNGWVWGWGGWSFYISNENNKCRSFLPALPLHTCTRAWLIIPVVMFTIYPPVMFTVDPPYAEKIRAFASMRYMLGNFNACVCRVWDGPIVFSAFATFHHLQVLNWQFCGMSPLTSHSVTRVSWGIVNRTT